jgi:hypothetical protein
VHGEGCRSWVTCVTDVPGEVISGCCWWGGSVYCALMLGPIVVLDSTHGIRQRVVRVNSQPLIRITLVLCKALVFVWLCCIWHP